MNKKICGLMGVLGLLISPLALADNSNGCRAKNCDSTNMVFTEQLGSVGDTSIGHNFEFQSFYFAHEEEVANMPEVMEESVATIAEPHLVCPEGFWYFENPQNPGEMICTEPFDIVIDIPHLGGGWSIPSF